MTLETGRPLLRKTDRDGFGALYRGCWPMGEFRDEANGVTKVCAITRTEWEKARETGAMFYGTTDLKDSEIFLRLRKTCGARPEKRWLPAYYFDICLADGTKIGQCDLRIGHNDKTYIGGNIGYGIDEAYRGHHYAAKACALLFRQARKHGMDHLIITCVPENAASSKTCLRAGGEYLETARIPEDNEMYAEGKRRVLVYRFAL